ncbi:hypothetical protein [Amycolatopsis sp. NPDC059657]|uniref:hypothetical protein n=1 Tax=Amycolatopsis sp. NPDC059657 TaxID=3346899 RepID=UPI00366DCFCD
MLKKAFSRYLPLVIAVTAVTAMTFMGTPSQTGVALDGGAASAANPELKGDPAQLLRSRTGQAESMMAPKPSSVDGTEAMPWNTPSKKSYTITSSCNSYKDAIRKGAAAWKNLTEGGGTPVECTNSNIQGCGGGVVVGCNQSGGVKIILWMSNVRDKALLAAHEFGHDWFGHTGNGCHTWSSAESVMQATTCE